jgi:small-conductance mechanosensitive channel
MPELINDIQSWVQDANLEFIWILASVVTGVFLGFLIYAVSFHLIKRLSKKKIGWLEISLFKHFKGPARLIIPAFGAMIIMNIQPFGQGEPPAEAEAIFSSHALVDMISKGISIILILGFAWLLIRGINVLEDYLTNSYQMNGEKGLRARKFQTQMKFLKRILSVIVILISFALILLIFENIQQLGATLLASAGVISIVVGFSIQQTLSRLFAGIQLAITQPIRLDDIVIVEGEWGIIEEITLTFVVVKIWDLRRLVVPINYFIENPFQNWTRNSPELLGTVFLYLDYSVPIEALREELKNIVQKSPHWDGKVQGIQITGSTNRHMEVRALVSAVNAPVLWDFRCEVREKLITFVNKNYPGSFAKIRTDGDETLPAGAEAVAGEPK